MANGLSLGEPIESYHRWSSHRFLSASGGTRTPNRLIRSQMLYPLSYERVTAEFSRTTSVAAPVAPVWTDPT